MVNDNVASMTIVSNTSYEHAIVTNTVQKSILGGGETLDLCDLSFTQRKIFEKSTT